MYFIIGSFSFLDEWVSKVKEAAGSETSNEGQKRILDTLLESRTKRDFLFEVLQDYVNKNHSNE